MTGVAQQDCTDLHFNQFWEAKKSQALSSPLVGPLKTNTETLHHHRLTQELLGTEEPVLQMAGQTLLQQRPPCLRVSSMDSPQ